MVEHRESVVRASLIGVVLVVSLTVVGTATAAAGFEWGVSATATTTATANGEQSGSQLATGQLQLANNSTAHHTDPRDRSTEGNLSEVRLWLQTSLRNRLNESAARISQGQYERGRELLGNEFDSQLSQLVNVTGETGTDTTGGTEERLERLKQQQKNLTEATAEYERTYEQYRAAKQANNRTGVRTYGRKLQRTARQIKTLNGTLQKNYDRLEQALGTELTTPQSKIGTVTSNISSRQQQINKTLFTETDITVSTSQSPRTISYADPLTVDGQLLTANGTAIANRTVRVRVYRQIQRVQTDTDGTFTLQYRPKTIPVNQSTIHIRYLPRPESEFLSASTTVPVTIEQVEATLSLTDQPDNVVFGDPIRATAKLTYNEQPISGVPLTATLAGTSLERNITYEQYKYQEQKQSQEQGQEGKREQEQEQLAVGQKTNSTGGVVTANGTNKTGAVSAVSERNRARTLTIATAGNGSETVTIATSTVVNGSETLTIANSSTNGSETLTVRTVTGRQEIPTLRVVTDTQGRMTVRKPIPANVSTGVQRLEVGLALENRALTADPASGLTVVEETNTTLSVTKEQLGPNGYRISGQLETANGVARAQPIELWAGNESKETIRTDHNGTFTVTVNASQFGTSGSSTVRVSVRFDGEGKNLETATTSVQLAMGPKRSSQQGLVVILTAVAGGVGLLTARRLFAQQQETASTDEPTTQPEADDEIPQLAPADTVNTVSADHGRKLLSDGATDAAVQYAYQQVRHTLQVNAAESDTHWEFFNKCRNNGLDENEISTVQELVQVYESTKFANQHVDEHTVKSLYDQIDEHWTSNR